MTITPKTERILKWREAIATLPDERFFNVMHLYLGKIKTPYNKQQLVESLSSFLCAPKNKAALISLLTEIDCKIIAAVKLLSHPTQETLSAFFSDTFTFADLYTHVVNLEERLILYRHPDGTGSQIAIDVNPIFEDDLAPYADASVLFTAPVFSERYNTDTVYIGPNLIAIYLAFVLDHPDMCKSDGSLKKKVLAELSSIYDEKLVQRLVPRLHTALCNLLLVHDDGRGIALDWQRLASFSALPEAEQYAYLVAASCGHFSRTVLQQNAKLFLKTCTSLQDREFSKNVVLQFSFLTRECDSESLTKSGRFAKLLADAQKKETSTGDSGIMDSMIDSACMFGLLMVTGRDTNGKSVLKCNPLFLQNSVVCETSSALLDIGSGFSVTILPGLSLAQLLQLVPFLAPVCHDTAVQFEVNRHSVMRAFNLGLLPGQIVARLERYCMHGVPQNVRISIEEWYNSYSSATLYKGYVLKVNKENQLLAEKNPALAPYIIQTLAPGIFLLNFTDDDEAQSVIVKSGLDFIGAVKTATTAQAVPPFAQLHVEPNKCILDASACKKPETTSADVIIAELKKTVAAMVIGVNQREALYDCIERRVILNASQLTEYSIRVENCEAFGMDYSGKLHLVESAVQDKNLLEVELEGGAAPLVGLPLLVHKKNGEAELTLRLEPTQQERTILVGSAIRIKKIQSPFS